MNKNVLTRVVMYLAGLFIMTIGISISVKSNLGVAPVSSVPYTFTVIWGVEMGFATTMFHAFMVLLQIIILRKNFKPINILQIAAGIIFGIFTTLSNSCIDILPTPENIAVRLMLIVLSSFLVAVGIFFYMPANIMPLAGEGLTQTISNKTGFKFSNVKTGFDITLVSISLLTCLIIIHKMGSVGAGTVISALLVGNILGVINNYFGAYRDKLLKT